MKKIVFIVAINSIFYISAIQAAGNGTINFTGVVNSQTCNATINSTSTTTLTLPAVQASVLETAGSTAGQTAFNITITGCATTNPSGAGSVKAFFEKGPNVDNNGRLINTEKSGGASNVSLQLVDSSGNKPINIGDITQNTDGYVSISSGNATLPYAVRYYAIGTATAGKVASSVTYSLIYN